jgi:hypothetical protein
MSDLCETCTKAKGGGCPIWPTLRITLECVEFIKVKGKK